MDFIEYAQWASEASNLNGVPLSFQGNDSIGFFTLDDGSGASRTYTYNELYGIRRYNFPLLYEYWDDLRSDGNLFNDIFHAGEDTFITRPRLLEDLFL